MTKIAITGANGFVGRHLVETLVAAGHEVLAIGGKSLPSNGKLTNKHITSVTIDLLKPEEVATIDLSDIDAVIHLAGLAAVGPSFDNPIGYISTNSALESNLFEHALKQGVKPRFILISSGSLYDPKSTLPITEKSAVVPNSPYAVSKITQEQLGHYYAGRGFEVIIARPFNHIGPGQAIGFLTSDLASQLVQYERGDTDSVLVGNLDAKRDYTDVRDIAQAYVALIENGQHGETYNICSGISLSGHEILDRLVAQLSTKPVIKQDKTRMRPADTPDIFGSHDKLQKHTGWEPAIAIEQTLADVIDFWRQQ